MEKELLYRISMGTEGGIISLAPLVRAMFMIKLK